MLALCLAALLAAPPVAPTVPTQLAWTVRHMDRDVGRLAFNRKGDRVRVRGKLTVPGSALTLELSSVSTLTPERTTRSFDWRFSVFGAPRSAVGRVNGDRMVATTLHDAEVTQRTDERRKSPLLDLISYGFWLAAHDAEPAPRAAAFAGYFLYDVFAVRGELETLALPTGPRRARRWEVTATRPGRTRTLTLWTDPALAIPVKAHVDLDFFGWVDVVLTR